MSDDLAKTTLHDQLRQARAALLGKLDGLSEYEIRRPLTLTGTNLLGLIKHVTLWEGYYFGPVFDRPAAHALPDWHDGDALDAYQWATADESRDEIVANCRAAQQQADETIDALPLDAPGHVPWWPRPDVTLAVVLTHVLTDIARHAGHADILREHLDGTIGARPDSTVQIERDDHTWRERRAAIEKAASTFHAGEAPSVGPPPIEFVDRNLRGARFTRVDLSRAVVRGAVIDDVELDSPWLLEGDSTLHVNGVDVAPYVDAELDQRFPGRALRRADDPAGLRAAWAALERTWAATLARAAALPEGTVDVSVEGEWSFAQTLRHLVLATDTWLGKAVLERPEPFHPHGLPHAEFESDGNDMRVFSAEPPSYEQALAARADRVAMVREFLDGVTDDVLAESRQNPHDPDYSESVLSCLHTILEEEWEHHRYAVRDLDAIE